MKKGLDDKRDLGRLQRMTYGRLVVLSRDLVSNHMTSTTCRENKARTEVLEEWCENGGLKPFDDDRRGTFMTRSQCSFGPTTEIGMKNKPSSQIETHYQ
jgi:hypothetical protein